MATQEPLKVDIENGNAEALTTAGVFLPPEPELKGPLKPITETTLKEALAAGVACLAVGTAIAVIVMEQSAVVVVAGLLSCVMGPYAWYQQTRLTDIAALKETTVAVQVEVDKLKTEISILSKNVDELGNTIDELQDIEEALEVISKSPGQSVSALEDLLARNKEILSNMKKSTKGRVIQYLIAIIFGGNDRCDAVISEGDANKLVDELRKISGLTVHEKRLRRALTGKPTEAAIDVVKNLLAKDVPADQKIFEVEE